MPVEVIVKSANKNQNNNKFSCLKLDDALSQNDTLLKRGYAGSNLISLAPGNEVYTTFIYCLKR